MAAEVVNLIEPEPMTGWRQQVYEGAIADKMRANLKAKKKEWDEKGEKAKADGYDALDKVKKTQADLEKSDYIQNVREGAAWTKKEGQNKNGGLNDKGRASLRAQGQDIKRPQPEGGKRKKSYCARSAGQLKMWPKAAKDPDSRLRKARRKWKCS